MGKFIDRRGIRAISAIKARDLVSAAGTPAFIEWKRADPKALAAFDPSTKQCSMNCGPHADDPRSHAERKFLCGACWPVASVKITETSSEPLTLSPEDIRGIQQHVDHMSGLKQKAWESSQPSFVVVNDLRPALKLADDLEYHATCVAADLDDMVSINPTKIRSGHQTIRTLVVGIQALLQQQTVKHEAITLARLYETIASDSHANSFDTRDAYRQALLKLIKGK